MIFSAIHMLIRMIKEKNPDYSDIGFGFIIMALFETFLWVMIGAVAFAMINV